MQQKISTRDKIEIYLELAERHGIKAVIGFLLTVIEEKEKLIKANEAKLAGVKHD